MTAKYSFQMVYPQNIDSKWFIATNIKEKSRLLAGTFYFYLYFR